MSSRSNESNTSVSNPNAKAKDDTMNECDAPVSLRTRAQELNTRKVPCTIEVSSCNSYCPTVPGDPTADVIA